MVGIYLDRVNIHCTTFIPCRPIATASASSPVGPCVSRFVRHLMALVSYIHKRAHSRRRRRHCRLNCMLAQGDPNWTESFLILLQHPEISRQTVTKICHFSRPQLKVVHICSSLVTNTHNPSSLSSCARAFIYGAMCSSRIARDLA